MWEIRSSRMFEQDWPRLIGDRRKRPPWMGKRKGRSVRDRRKREVRGNEWRDRLRYWSDWSKAHFAAFAHHRLHTPRGALTAADSSPRWQSRWRKEVHHGQPSGRIGSGLLHPSGAGCSKRGRGVLPKPGVTSALVRCKWPTGRTPTAPEGAE